MKDCPAAFVLKVAITDLDARDYSFAKCKTMYAGRTVATGDAIYLFASENAGGVGLFARGRVSFAAAVPRLIGVERQTPLVSIAVGNVERAEAPLGRAQLRGFAAWDDGRPETELNFKLYRQATDKIIGIGAATARFLDTLFQAPSGRPPL